jgi:hypothetical protein
MLGSMSAAMDSEEFVELFGYLGAIFRGYSVAAHQQRKTDKKSRPPKIATACVSSWKPTSCHKIRREPSRRSYFGSRQHAARVVALLWSCPVHRSRDEGSGKQ